MGLPARRGLSPGRLPFRHCRVWSAWLDSNQRPHPSEGCALPGCATRCDPENGGQGRNRTSTDYAGRLQRLGLTNAQPARRAARACGAGNPCHGRPEEAAMARGLSLIRRDVPPFGKVPTMSKSVHMGLPARGTPGRNPEAQTRRSPRRRRPAGASPCSADSSGFLRPDLVSRGYDSPLTASVRKWQQMERIREIRDGNGHGGAGSAASSPSSHVRRLGHRRVSFRRTVRRARTIDAPGQRLCQADSCMNPRRVAGSVPGRQLLSSVETSRSNAHASQPSVRRAGFHNCA